MSIIQQIREKYAAVVIGLIALSLIGFILMDSAGRGGGGGVDPNDAIGEVNGRRISYLEFLNRTKSVEQLQEMNGRAVDEVSRQQIYADVWRTMVESTLMEGEFEKLGITVTDKEFNDLLFGSNPPEWLKQEFTDPQTGQFDVVAAKQAIAQLKKVKGNPQSAMIEEYYLNPLIDNTLRSKYFALLQNSTYVPNFLVEKTMADNSAIANIRFVQVPYTTIPDSAAVVTDAMVNDYVKKHAREFRQDEAVRSIAYVSFPFVASAEDSANTLNEVLRLKEEFATTSEPGVFVSRNASVMPFYDGYNSRERIQIAAKDSILGPVGHVYGPFIDGNSYVISRVVDVKTMPDSVKARHILIGTFDPRTQQLKLDDSTAKARIDSIERVIKGGASFAELAKKLSDDEGSAEKGGDLGYFAGGMMVKEFNDFCFEKPKGSMGVVKTQFGYHLIEITDQKNFAPSYKIAYLARGIDASQATINEALNAANGLAGNSRDLKSFEENITKSGYNKLIATDIKENDFMVPGLGVSRRMVRDIFEATPGKVLEPIELDNQYVVAAVTGAEKAGLQSAAKVRPMVESILRNELKGKMIKEKIGQPASLEAVASANNTFVQTADSISFVSPMLAGAGFEPKVGGAAFAKANLNKVSAPISGNSGVYVIEVSSVGAQSNTMQSAADLKNSLMMQQRNIAMYGSMQALREKASIKDKRTKFL